MERITRSEQVERFVVVLLRTGLMLSDLAGDLLDALPDDSYPGEENSEVVLEMIRGTIATSLQSATLSELARATELMERAFDRTIEHLEQAREIAAVRSRSG